MITETRELTALTYITPTEYNEEYKYCQDCGASLLDESVSVDNGFNPLTGERLGITRLIHCPNYAGGTSKHYAWGEEVRFEREYETPIFQPIDWGFTPRPDRSISDTTGI